MTNQDVLARNQIYSYEEEGKPYASYIKTILGQVGVNVWDRFVQQPAYVILKGDPKRKEESCIVDVWNAREDAFFRRNNQRHFDKGLLISYSRPENVVTETPIEQYTDEQLKEIIDMKFIALGHKLNKIETIPVLFRMVSLAEEAGKSSKITDAIQARISEIQLDEYKPKVETKEED